MRDEIFQMFVERFGEATHREVVPQASVEKYRGRLPDQLLTYWEVEGWCAYDDGLIWTVNPADYEDLIDEWLEGSPLEEIDAYHVIARSAMGDLYVCGEIGGQNMTVSCFLHSISVIANELRPKSIEDRNLSIQAFFAVREQADCDIEDENGKPLFKRALKKLGSLSPNQMYGFEPAVIVGGRIRLESLRIVDLDVHLSILREFSPPRMPFGNFDFAKLSD